MKKDFLTKETKEHLIFLLREFKEIPQVDDYQKKLVNEKVDNFIFKIKLQIEGDEE